MVDDVVQQYFDSDDDCTDNDYNPDEPVMEGNNNAFCDLEGNELDEGNLDTRHNTPPTSSAGASTSSGD